MFEVPLGENVLLLKKYIFTHMRQGARTILEIEHKCVCYIGVD